MAVSELKNLHPYLYKRVALKGWLFILLGLSSIFSSYLDGLIRATRNNVEGISPVITGGIFLFIGLGIIYGLLSSPQNYRKSRGFLYAALIYAVFWEFVLLMLAITKDLSTISIFVLWGYLTYNLSLIVRDTAWAGAEIIKELREDNGTI